MRAAEGIDRLVVVADAEVPGAAAAEELEPPVLQAVSVLELVDQDVLEALRIMGAQDLVPFQQLVAAQEQLREIDDALALQLLVVGGVEVGHAARVLVRDGYLARANALLLVGVDEPAELARREALIVHVEALRQALDQRELVL